MMTNWHWHALSNPKWKTCQEEENQQWKIKRPNKSHMEWGIQLQCTYICCKLNRNWDLRCIDRRWSQCNRQLRSRPTRAWPRKAALAGYDPQRTETHSHVALSQISCKFHQGLHRNVRHKESSQSNPKGISYSCIDQIDQSDGAKSTTGILRT